MEMPEMLCKMQGGTGAVPPLERMQYISAIHLGLQQRKPARRAACCPRPCAVCPREKILRPSARLGLVESREGDALQRRQTSLGVKVHWSRLPLKASTSAPPPVFFFDSITKQLYRTTTQRPEIHSVISSLSKPLTHAIAPSTQRCGRPLLARLADLSLLPPVTYRPSLSVASIVFLGA
jgi:hypothetical protein